MQSKQTKFRLIWSTRLHLVGSATFMLTGIGHLMTHFLSPETPEQLEMMHLMEQFSIDMPGTQTNLLLFYEGFSILMGILLFSFGLINLILYKLLQKAHKVYTNVLIIDCLVASVSLAIALQHFFIVPVVLMALATLCFVCVFLLGFGGSNAADTTID